MLCYVRPGRKGRTSRPTSWALRFSWSLGWRVRSIQTAGLDTKRVRRVAVAVQAPLAGSRRSLDLELLGVTAVGEPVARLWCESKIKAPETKEQLSDQFKVLRRLGPSGNVCLMAIVRSDRAGRRILETRGRPPGFALKIRSWEDIAELVEQIGRRDGRGQDWRLAAGDADAPARLRVMRELMWWLEREKVIVECFSSTE